MVSNASVALSISFHSPFGPLEFGISNLYLLTYMGVKNLGRPTAHTTHLLTPLCFDDDRQVQTKQAGKRPRNIAPDMLSIVCFHAGKKPSYLVAFIALLIARLPIIVVVILRESKIGEVQD